MNYRIEFLPSIKEVRAFMGLLARRQFIPKIGILFINAKGTPIAAYAPNGYAGGLLYTRRDVKNGKRPSHRYAGSADAYDFLEKSVTHG